VKIWNYSDGKQCIIEQDMVLVKIEEVITEWIMCLCFWRIGICVVTGPAYCQHSRILLDSELSVCDMAGGRDLKIVG